MSRYEKTLKKLLIDKFNKVVKLRSNAYLMEKKFIKLFKEIYGFEFDPSKYDNLVDSLQMGLHYITLEEFENIIKNNKK